MNPATTALGLATSKIPRSKPFAQRWLFFFAVLALWLAASALAPAHAQSGKRIAFVIGNAKYEGESTLANPHNDAALLAGVFKNDLRFDEVVQHRDLNRKQMYDLVREVARKSKGADSVVVYYSGHGMRGGGDNYLIPTDARIADEDDVRRDALAATELVDALQASNARVALLILDACRDSPYSKRTKSASKGLARMGVTSGNMLVAYATSEGSTADDGKGGNSPYAQALAQHLRNTRLPLLSQFDAVRRSVREATGNKQNPTREGDLETGVYLLASVVPEPAPQALLSPEPVRLATVRPEPVVVVPQRSETTATVVPSPLPTTQSARELSLKPIQVTGAGERPRSGSYVFHLPTRREAYAKRRSFESTQDLVVIETPGQSPLEVNVGFNSKTSLKFNRSGTLLLITQYGGDQYVVRADTGVNVASPQEICGGARRCNSKATWLDDNTILVSDSDGLAMYSILEQKRKRVSPEGFSLLDQRSSKWILKFAKAPGVNPFSQKLGLYPWNPPDGSLRSAPLITISDWAHASAIDATLATYQNGAMRIYSQSGGARAVEIPLVVSTDWDNPPWLSKVLLVADGRIAIAHIGTKRRESGVSEIRVWSAQDGRPLFTGRANKSQLAAVASADGQWLAFNQGYDDTGNNHRIAVVNMRTGISATAPGMLTEGAEFESNRILRDISGRFEVID